MFQLLYRATEGLIKSLMRLCQLDLPVPDHTHLSRRAGELSVKIPRRPRQGPTHVVVDSTGLKIFGEGEWAKAGFLDARATIPPRDGAVMWGDDHPRDAILREIEAKGLDGWKNESGYHRRRIAENMMYRLKQLGDCLYSRTLERQVTEAPIRAAILKPFTDLGMPQSVRVGQVASAA